MERETMEFDVVIVGAGPSGLAAACRIMQQAKAASRELTVCVIEKGSEVGAHILSGAILETTALDELFPDWQAEGAPVTMSVTRDEVYWLNNDHSARQIPHWLVPKTMNNQGNYIVSMGNVCRWLAQRAEELGVDIFPGFPAADILYHDNGAVAGVVTGDMGISATGAKKDSYMPGMELNAKFTLFAEGSRGHLGKRLIKKYALNQHASPQHYAIGFKEIWDIDPAHHQPGLVIHTTGWPLDPATGGGFLYHSDNHQVYVGLIIDLNYSNPYLSPFDEFQRMKHHPVFSQYFKNSKRVAYGARAITKGGLTALPQMSFPGGLLIGCNAGTLNFAKIKGNHTAMKSGMLAADAIFEKINQSDHNSTIDDFDTRLRNSWLYTELNKSKNFGAAIHKFGALWGGAFNSIEQNIFNGNTFVSLKDRIQDHQTLTKKTDATAIDYPKPDGKLSFDKLSSVYLSNTNHDENQPCHLKLKDSQVPVNVNLVEYDEPAQRYCPAGVYEIVEENNTSYFQINAQNCIHCKTCDIKDPSQNICWVTPEGGGGPNYPNM